jgi:7,8-dihydropterin-6-yl-methyl-4-(beta-D-ribofuranosyl)aminobenzene 5'-phosphate synthase
MRNLASITLAGWIRSLLLAILVLLSACLPSPERGETTPYPAGLTTEPISSVGPTQAVTHGPVLASPLLMVTVEPSQAVAQSQITATGSEERKGAVMIRVVYDNVAYDRRLGTAWGFACLVEAGEKTILFDTGGDGAILLRNMGMLGVDPKSVEVVVLSHIHGDHTGGLESLLKTDVRPTVYLPRSFPSDFKSRVRVQADVVEVVGAMEIAEGVYTTGEMGSGIIEQALVVQTRRGLVVVTGCAHPGISEMVGRAADIGGDEVYLVLGGFHLGGTSQARVEETIAEFRRLGVEKVAPSHCTGDNAIRLFREAYGQDFIASGAGREIEIAP